MKPEFEWNKDKAEKNIRNHHVSFDEAKSVFDDPVFITVVDEEHSADEERYISIGLSENGRLLMIAHTDRDDRDERIRIISARKATKKEEKFYADAG